MDLPAIHRTLKSLISHSHSPVLATFPADPRPLFANLYKALNNLEVCLLELNEPGTSHDVLLLGLLQQLSTLDDLIARNAYPLDNTVALDFYNRIDFYRYSAQFLASCAPWRHDLRGLGSDITQAVFNEATSISIYLLRFFTGIQPTTGPSPSPDEACRIDYRIRETGEAIERKLRREADDPWQIPSKIHGEVVWRTRHAMYWLSRAEQSASMSRTSIGPRRPAPAHGFEEPMLTTLEDLIKASWLANTILLLPEFTQAPDDLKAPVAWCLKGIFALWNVFGLNFFRIDYIVLSDRLPIMWEIAMPGDPQPPSPQVVNPLLNGTPAQINRSFQTVSLPNNDSRIPLAGPISTHDPLQEDLHGAQGAGVRGLGLSSPPTGNVRLAYRHPSNHPETHHEVSGPHHSYRHISAPSVPANQPAPSRGVNLQFDSNSNSRPQRRIIDVNLPPQDVLSRNINPRTNLDGLIELEGSLPAMVPHPNLPELGDTSNRDPVEIGSSSAYIDPLSTHEFEVFNIESITEQNIRGSSFVSSHHSRLLTREGSEHFAQSRIRVFKHNNLLSPQYLRISAQQAGVEQPLEMTVRIKSSELVPDYVFTRANRPEVMFYIRDAGERLPISIASRANTNDEDELSEFYGLQGIFLGCFPERQTFITHFSLTLKKTSRRHRPQEIVANNVLVQVYTDAPATFDANAAASIYSVNHIESAPRKLSNRISQSGINEDALFATRYYFFIEHCIYVLIVSTRYSLIKKTKSSSGEHKLIFRPMVEEKIPTLRLAVLRGSPRNPPGIPLDRSELRYRHQLGPNGTFAEFDSLKVKFSRETEMNAFYNDHKQYLKQWEKQYQLLKVNEYREMYPQITTNLDSPTRSR